MLGLAYVIRLPTTLARSVMKSVCPSVFWTNWPLTSLFACVEVMTIACGVLNLKVKAIGQGQRSRSVCVLHEYILRRAMNEYWWGRVRLADFHCAVIGCKLAGQGVRHDEAACGYHGKQLAMNGSRRGQWRLQSVWRRSSVGGSIPQCSRTLHLILF